MFNKFPGGALVRGREYLEELKRLSVFIKQREKELEELREKAYGISAVNTEREKVAGGRKPLCSVIDKYIDREREIHKIIDEYMDKKHSIIGEIQKMKNPLYAEILYKRYVDFESLEKIADEMNYNYNYIRRVHGNAVKEFEEEVISKKNVLA